MGRKNVLIDGISGSGKTTIAEELERRGHHVIHGDRVLAYHGDPQSGMPLTLPEQTSQDTILWAYDRWIWPLDKVRALAADQTHDASFFCGHAANLDQFSELFDAIFGIYVDRPTLITRLARRGEEEFGGRPIERDVVIHLHATRTIVSKDALSIDANGDVADIVDAILAQSDISRG